MVETLPQIRIEGFEVFGPRNPGDFGHLYLVYVDENGHEFVIRGGPGKGAAAKILVEVGVPMSQSKDDRNKPRGKGNTEPQTREQRGSRVIMSGPEAAAAWAQMTNYTEAIGLAKIKYVYNGPNSNTVIAAVLKHVGIDVRQVLPNVKGVDGTLFNGPYPGIDADDVAKIEAAINNPKTEQEDQAFVGRLTVGKGAIGFGRDIQKQREGLEQPARDDHSGLLPGDGGLEGSASGVAASDIPPAPVSWETSGWDEEDSTRFYKNMEKLAEHTRKLRELQPAGLYNDRGEEIGPSILARLDWPWDTDANGSGARDTLYAGYATPSGSARPPGARTRGIGSSWARGKARPVTPLPGRSLPGVGPSPDIGPLLDIGPPPYSQGADPVRESSRLRGPYFRLRPQDMGRQPRPSGPSTETVPVTRYQASETVPDLPYFPDNPLLQEMIYISPKGMAWRRALQAEAASVATPPVDPDPTRYRGDRRRQFKPLLDLTPWLPQTD